MSYEKLQNALLQIIEAAQIALSSTLPEDAISDGVGVCDIVRQKQKECTKTRKVEIVREPSTDEGTFGVLLIDGKEFCKTAELPWRNNERKVSCVPTGTYSCKMIKRASNGQDAYWLEDVPGRNPSNIVIHSGNSPIIDSRGCPLLGMSLGTVSGRRAVTQSRDAISAFHKEMNREPFTLIIRNA